MRILPATSPSGSKRDRQRLLRKQGERNEPAVPTAPATTCPVNLVIDASVPRSTTSRKERT